MRACRCFQSRLCILSQRNGANSYLKYWLVASFHYSVDNYYMPDRIIHEHLKKSFTPVKKLWTKKGTASTTYAENNGRLEESWQFKKRMQLQNPWLRDHFTTNAHQNRFNETVCEGFEERRGLPWLHMQKISSAEHGEAKGKYFQQATNWELMKRFVELWLKGIFFGNHKKLAPKCITSTAAWIITQTTLVT